MDYMREQCLSKTQHNMKAKKKPKKTKPQRSVMKRLHVLMHTFRKMCNITMYIDFCATFKKCSQADKDMGGIK